MDTKGAWMVSRLAAGMQVEGDQVDRLEEPWYGAAEAIESRNGASRIDALRAYCEGLPDGKAVFDTILDQNPRHEPRAREVYFEVPPLPGPARLDPGLAEGAATWLEMYSDYAKRVSPRTPDSFHRAGGLWLISLVVARRLVLRLSHKDLYPNLAILQVAPTTIYAKSTGMNVPRGLAASLMPHLLLPGAMTPEEMYNELAGQQPVQIDQLDMENWNKARAYAGQRGVCLDEASSVFAGLRKDYNVGMGELLCRLYDCTPYDARQTRALGRIAVRDAYWSFLGATTAWHLRQADTDSLWHTGLWPRFLLLTPAGPPVWEPPKEDRVDVPPAVTGRLRKLLETDLQESKYGEAPEMVGMGLGKGVFAAYGAYCKAMMHTLLLPPTTVDVRLYGVYGRLPEQALKIAMLLAAIAWDGDGAPVIELGHWTWAQRYTELCRHSAHRLPEMIGQGAEDTDEERMLGKLTKHYPEWVGARALYKPLKLKSTMAKALLSDLVEAGLVEERQQTAKRYEYRLNRDKEEVINVSA